MNFDLNDKQKAIRDMARKFAAEVIVPRAAEMERSEAHPYDVIAEMGELGMMGIPFPGRYGGRDGDWVSMGLCLEEIARAEELPAVVLSVTVSGVAQELFVFGTEEQKQRWLVPMAQGKKIGAFGLTEPDAGSDNNSLRTRAVLEGDEWVINGTKQFITNAGLDNTSIVIVAAKTERPKDGKTIVCTIIVPKDAPGFKVGAKYDKMGNHGISTRELFFDNCRVPKNFLLGDINKGLSQHLSSVQTGRISMGAISTGMAQACLDEALSFTAHRYQGRRALFKDQAIPFKLADIAIEVELCRFLYLKASWLKDMGEDHTFEAHAAKLYASETGRKIAGEVLRIFSPYGYFDQFPISRYFRQAKLHEIVDGTSEMQRLIISRQILKTGAVDSRRS